MRANMLVYQINVTKAPEGEGIGPYYSLSPWTGDTKKYEATCETVEISPETPMYSYIRVSKDEQGKKENSPVQQRELILTACVRDGIDPTSLIWATDIGKRRHTPLEKRPELAAMVANIRKNSRVYIANRDRLGAGILNAHIHYLIRQGGGILVSAEGFNSEHVGDRVYRAVKDEMSVEESANISRRVSGVLRSRKAKGQTYTSRIYGMQKVSILDGRVVETIQGEPKVKDEDFRFEVNPKEQEVVDWILKGRKRGAKWNELARRLNRAGVPAPKGQQWWHTSVRSVYTTHMSLKETA